MHDSHDHIAGPLVVTELTCPHLRTSRGYRTSRSYSHVHIAGPFVVTERAVETHMSTSQDLSCMVTIRAVETHVSTSQDLSCMVTVRQFKLTCPHRRTFRAWLQYGQLKLTCLHRRTSRDYGTSSWNSHVYIAGPLVVTVRAVETHMSTSQDLSWLQYGQLKLTCLHRRTSRDYSTGSWNSHVYIAGPFVVTERAIKLRIQRLEGTTLRRWFPFGLATSHADINKNNLEIFLNFNRL